MTAAEKIGEAQAILKAPGLPARQQNRMSALTLLSILDVKPDDAWASAMSRLIGIDAIRQWIAAHYGIVYAPNTRETIRRQAVHYFMQANVVERNPDNPARATNDKNNVYAATSDALNVVHRFGLPGWTAAVESFRAAHGSLVQRFAAAGSLHRVPVVVAGEPYRLSPGRPNALQAAIINDFGPRFAPGADVLYLGVTEDKDLILESDRLAELGVSTSQHDPLPDVMLFVAERNWLYLVEAVTSHGPISPKRYEELRVMLSACQLGLVFVTAFPDHATFCRHAADIAWRTEVWIADRPDHLVHFDGERFLGPYPPAPDHG